MKYPQNEEQAVQVIREFDEISFNAGIQIPIKRDIDFKESSLLLKVEIVPAEEDVYLSMLFFEIGALDESENPYRSILLSIEELNKITEIANIINDKLK